jgi:hypothetical protein
VSVNESVIDEIRNNALIFRHTKWFGRQGKQAYFGIKEGRANRLILELLAYFGIPAKIRK